MDAVHALTGIAVLATSLGAGTVGGAGWLRDRPSVAFWYLLRVAQVTVVLQIGLGAVVLLSGHEAQSGLHYIYGALPLLVSLLAEGARAGVAEHELTGLDFDALPRERRRAVAHVIARREQGIMAVACLVIFLLALRAAGTTPLI